jgi:hypothetical protein
MLGNNLDILLKYFPDAVLITNGLDSGKYETDEYLFHIQCNFWTSKITGHTDFVSTNWEDTLIQLKEINNKYKSNKEADAIVKDSLHL